ncbi:MAG: hypothetical protein EHM36_11435, partial [Deltaproteobacteria bacterium]
MENVRLSTGRQPLLSTGRVLCNQPILCPVKGQFAMDKSKGFGKIKIKSFQEEEKHEEPLSGKRPFKIAVLGDFSGREDRDLKEALANRHFHLIDRDQFDEVLAKLKAEVHLPILGKTTSPIRIRFSELDDFHPDCLFENVEVFEALKETRQGLKDLSALGKKVPPIPVTPKGTEIPLQTILSEKREGLLGQVLERTQGEPSQPGASRGSSEWNDFLREIVRPHVVPDAHQEQAEAQALVDAATGELMRRILHHPDFQAIEAAWRGLYFLVSRLET